MSTIRWGIYIIAAVAMGCLLLCPGIVSATAPYPSNVNTSTPPNTSCTITLTATHSEGGPLTFKIMSNPSHGTLTGTAPNLVYTPALDFWGNDEFTYAVSDSGGDTSWTAPVSIDVAVVIDNDSPAGVTITGAWSRDTPTWGYYWGASYLDDGNTGKGPGKYVTFIPGIPKEGIYDVHIWHPSYDSFGASNVPVDITYGSLTGQAVTQTLSVNERLFGGGWKYLGQYIFNATASQAKIKMRTDGTTDGYVTADAFKFVFVKPLPVTVPAAPSGLSAQVQWRNVRLTWNNNSVDEDGIKIEQSTDNVNFNEIASKTTGTAEYVTNPRTLGTTYYFRVRAYNSRGYSGYSNVATATTPALTSEVIPPERRVDWTQAGIPGGIPNRTTKCATSQCVALETTGASGSNDMPLIQAAIDSSSAGQYVRIPVGTYIINGTITISKDSITVRGDGPGATILDAHGSGSVIQFGSGAPGDLIWSTTTRALNVVSGATKGSTSVVLNSTTGISVGGYIQIDQLNEPGLVIIEGNEGTCSWCSRYSGARTQGQIMEVTAINGTAVSFQPALYWTYSSSLAPQVLPFSAGRKNSGVENLTVRVNDTGYTANFSLSGCAYCWLKGVEGDFTDGDHAQIISSYRCEVRDSYFHDAYHHTPGQTDADLFIAGKSSGILVENNIFWRLHCSIMFDWGASGNVIAYNYSDSTFDERAPNVLMMDMSVHGAHPMFNLWEGNIAVSLHPDGTWGSSSHSTAFRNWFKGSTMMYNPITGRGAVDLANGWPATQANRAINLDFGSRYYNLIGNVVGSEWTKNNNGITMLVWPQYRAYENTGVDFSFGYGGAGDGGDWPGGSDLAYTTVLLHGNYDHVSNSVLWDPGIASRTIPASMYLGSKPAWFGTYQWPPFDPNDPQLSNLTAFAAAVHIPAQYCFQQAIKPGGIFNPAACYASTPAILYGDVSENNSVTAYDASLASQYAVGLITLTSTQISKADVSGNSSVTAYDASLIAQYAVGLITKFPIEG